MLTSLSTTTVNVQVFPGANSGSIDYYQVYNSYTGSGCNVDAQAVLKDCTATADAGKRTSFYVSGAKYGGGYTSSIEGYVTPLWSNRTLFTDITHFFSHTFYTSKHITNLLSNLLKFIFTATQTIKENERTATSITVEFTPNSVVTGYEIVLRSVYTGAFSGSCDIASRRCTASGLVPAMAYEIWLRTCTQTTSVYKNCDLRAQSISLATRPGRKFCQTFY